MKRRVSDTLQSLLLDLNFFSFNWLPCQSFLWVRLQCLPFINLFICGSHQPFVFYFNPFAIVVCGQPLLCSRWHSGFMMPLLNARNGGWFIWLQNINLEILVETKVANVAEGQISRVQRLPNKNYAVWTRPQHTIPFLYCFSVHRSSSLSCGVGKCCSEANQHSAGSHLCSVQNCVFQEWRLWKRSANNEL